MNEPLKVGDLAVVVSSPYTPEKVGMVCTVLKLKPRRSSLAGGLILQALIEFPRPVRWAFGNIGPRGWLGAHRLRPIRDQPGEDETLTWKDKPIPLVAPESPTVREYEYEIRSHSVQALA
jgi:hypothetical protein